MKLLILSAALALLTGCANSPTPWVLGEQTNTPIGDVMCNEDRPDVCD